MINIELWEEWGAPNLGRGTSSSQVTNFNWKNTGNGDTPFHLSLLRRPTDPCDVKLSYKKYNYFKITGTYSRLVRPKLVFTPGRNDAPDDAHRAPVIATNTALYYKLSWTYAQPDNQFDGEMMHVMTDGDREVEFLLPLSTSPIQYEPYKEEFLSPNVVLYTPYIVTQLMVKPVRQIIDADDSLDTQLKKDKAEMDDVGNSFGTTIKFSVIEHQ